MKHYGNAPYATYPFLAWANLAVKTGEMLLASAQVISHRSGRMATAGHSPNARDRREFRLMGQEKIEAVADSAQAVAIRMMTINQRLGMMILQQTIEGSGRAMSLAMRPALSGKRQAELLSASMMKSAALGSTLAGAAVQLAQQGLKPIHARATGNAKRLLRRG